MSKTRFELNLQNLLGDISNPNRDIFVIPSEEGGIQEDNYLSSIGDATINHIQALSLADRQVWENFTYFSNTGSIFRFEDNPFHRDTDPLNLEGEENLEKAFEIKVLNSFKKGTLSPDDIETLKNLFQEEINKRQDSNDIFYSQTAVPFEEWTVFQETEESFQDKDEEEKREEDSYEDEDTEDKETPESNYYINNDPVPYHKWQEYPQLHRYWDVGSTPPQIPVWCGEGKTSFYDEYVINHENQTAYNTLFSLLNRDWDDITSNYIQWVNTLIPDDYKPFIHEVDIFLAELITGLSNKDMVAEDHIHLENLDEEELRDPYWRDIEINHSTKEFLDNYRLKPYQLEEKIIEVLSKIDQESSKLYLKKFFTKRDENPIDNLISMQENEWGLQYRKGNSPYQQIKQFGSLLFQNFKEEMQFSHWRRYKSLKAKYSPAITYRNLDLNRASIKEMTRELDITKQQAKDIWFSRPFENIGQLNKHKFFNSSNLTENKETENIINLIEFKFNESVKFDDANLLTSLAKNLKNIEFARTTTLNEDEWETVWFYYRIFKTELFNLNKEKLFKEKDSSNKEEQRTGEKTNA